jgi:hypothetical protein
MSFAPSSAPSLDAAFFGSCGLPTLLGESMVELGLGVVCQPSVGQLIVVSLSRYGLLPPLFCLGNERKRMLTPGRTVC